MLQCDLCPGPSGADPDPAAILVGPTGPSWWEPQVHPNGTPRAIPARLLSLCPWGGRWWHWGGSETQELGSVGQGMMLSPSEVTAEVPPEVSCASGCPTAEGTNSLHLSPCSWKSEGR